MRPLALKGIKLLKQLMLDVPQLQLYFKQSLLTGGEGRPEVYEWQPDTVYPDGVLLIVDGGGVAELYVTQAQYTSGTSVAVDLAAGMILPASQVQSVTYDSLQGKPSAFPPAVTTAENKDTDTICCGAPVAAHASGAGVVRASSAVPGACAVGVSIVTRAKALACDIIVSGIVKQLNWSNVTGTAVLMPRATYYLSDVPGRLVGVPPTTQGTLLQVIGTSVSETELAVHIAQPIRL